MLTPFFSLPLMLLHEITGEMSEGKPFAPFYSTETAFGKREPAEKDSDFIPPGLKSQAGVGKPPISESLRLPCNKGFPGFPFSSPGIRLRKREQPGELDLP
jgi:hypothetical protein